MGTECLHKNSEKSQASHLKPPAEAAATVESKGAKSRSESVWEELKGELVRG